MSTSPDFRHPDEELMALLSQWLQGELGNDELRKRVEEVDSAYLAPGQRDAVEELMAQLRNALPGERAELERVVADTRESLAYG
jgi:hypothetical protein